MQGVINWARVKAALFQFARRRSIPETRTRRTLRLLPRLLELCGEHSQSRKVAQRVGRVLLASRRGPDLWVPSCPAFSHKAGRYTYRGLGTGVPLLVKLHVPFVQQVLEVLGGRARVHILVADQEAAIEPLAERIGIDTEEFARRVRCSIAASRREVDELGWQVSAMTEFVPGFLSRVSDVRAEFVADEKARARIQMDAMARQRVYDMIGYPHDVREDRSADTLAQYVALGRHAAERSAIIVNHSTSSLTCLKRTDAGFLHNPVRVY